MPRMYEQVDCNPATYHWILDQVPRRLRRTLERRGWKWSRGVGCPGAFYTFDRDEARVIALYLGLEIGTNGTHKATGQPADLATLEN